MADGKLPPLNKFLITALFGGSDFGLDNDNPSGEQEDFPTVVEKVFADQALRKAGGASLHDESWDEPIGTTPAAPPPKDFIKSSDARFARVCAELKKVFGEDHEEELAEAIELAKKMRAEARAEALAR
jgi:hypothetical protein